MQQVDLYKAEFRPRRILLSLNQIVASASVALVICSLGSLFLETRLDEARAGIVTERAAEAVLRQVVSDLETEVSNRAEDNSLQLENERLKQALVRGAKLLKVVNEQRPGDDFSVAGILHGLAQQDMNGMSISQIHIGEGPELLIEGKTHSAERIPRYLKQLGEVDVFKGMRFDELQLDAQEGPMAFKVASIRLGERTQ